MKKLMPQVRLVVLLSLWPLAIAPSSAQHMNEPDSPCTKVVVTSDLVDCLSKARVLSHAELNSLYQKIRNRLDPSDAERLTVAQRLWIQYRDANCSAERSLYEFGTASSPAYLACLESMIRARTKELRVTYTVRLK
ncbi:MAG: DUF1311 domain-containing protein [Acidobacteriia bacterium]|nr:DUF1311 domain-containing protein [Terriglobia bacterium]